MMAPVNEYQTLEAENALLKESLEDCLALATAWAGYYSVAETYGQNGIVHPVHQAIINKAHTVLGRGAALAYPTIRGPK